MRGAGSSRGRPHAGRQSHTKRQAEPQQKAPYPPPSAFVQAYEANLIWDEPTRAVEQGTRSDDLPESSRAAGKGLIRWQGEGDEVWADRYDILHLLPSLPTAGPSVSRAAGPRSSSSSSSTSSSWEDLPSDEEETFDLSSDEEYEAYERSKRVQQLARLREARLKEREVEDEAIKIADEKKHSNGWGGDDEVVPSRRDPHSNVTYRPLNFHLSEPFPIGNAHPGNHSTDDRFSFLRGRYKDTWIKVKDQVRRDKRQDPKLKQKEEKNVGMLVGGYESDSDEPEEPESPPPPPPDDDEFPPAPSGAPLEPVPNQVEDQVPDSDEQDEEEARRRERRKRVEEWKRGRAA